MEDLLVKIRELEKDAAKLVKQQIRSGEKASSAEKASSREKLSSGEKISIQGPEAANLSFGHWIRDLRAKAGDWTAEPLVVLSLFDGIGGVWAVLSLLGIPFIGYSCEVNNAASQVVKARYPMVRHVGDITGLQKSAIAEKVDLIVGGFPCQDLTCLGHKIGLHGQRSKLFFEMLRVIKLFDPTWFLAENVASMVWHDRDEISKHLRTIPIEIDSQELTPSRRRRLYWSNIPYPKKLPQLRDHKSSSLQSVLKNGTALNSKIGCILSQNLFKGQKAALDLVMDNATCALRYVSVTEVEMAMGYPAGYTNVTFKSDGDDSDADSELEVVGQVMPSRSGRMLRTRQVPRTPPPVQLAQLRPVGDRDNQKLRWSLLGNTFSVNVIAYLLSPLLERAIRAAPRPIVLPEAIGEQECSAMDPGEVWALYNSHERPNWYALIASREGDRFSSCTQVKGKKSPLHIEVRFMEMTRSYAAEEMDEWDAIRGTGLFQVRAMTDNQNSWVAFSHRIENYWKFGELYFIFPANDEVWAVYDAVAHSRYLVYVVESYVDKSKAKEGQPGQESFQARCRLMQLVERELYRLLDKEIVYTELSKFAFKAPYVFRNEGTLLKIDLTSRQRAGMDFVRQQKRKRRRRGSDSSDSDSESEDEGEEMLEEDAALADIMGDSITRPKSWQDCNDSPATGRSGICDV